MNEWIKPKHPLSISPRDALLQSRLFLPLVPPLSLRGGADRDRLAPLPQSDSNDPNPDRTEEDAEDDAYNLANLAPGRFLGPVVCRAAQGQPERERR